MKNIYYLLIILQLAFVQNSISQAVKIDSVLNYYSTNYQPEKIYLQFDKYLYNTGETIWFKAYILNGTDLSDLSKNFYVDFFDAKGNLLKHFITPVYQSSAKGQFDIPVKYDGSLIHIKAYTQWMLNFDSSFNYTKDIVVAQTKVTKQPVIEPVTSLSLFPEGGDLVEGLNSRIGFLAVNQSGFPVSVKGTILNKKGESVDSFQSQHDGMGSFDLDVQPNEKYTLQWKDSYGKTYTSNLPEAKHSGLVMRVQSIEQKSLVEINRSEQADASLEHVYLVATFDQQLIYRSKLSLTGKTAGVAQIPTGALPSGVLQITVFNANWVPLTERVVFVNNHNHEFITDLNAGIKSLERKGKNVFEISVPDSIPCNLSVAVTDADIPTARYNIISQFLLCDDIKGYVHHPTYYFENESDSTAHHLDLVMLTHGWRKFNWKEAFSGTGPTLNYKKDSDYIRLEGKVFVPSNLKIPSDQQIFLILQTKDSSKQSLILPVKQDGSFMQAGVFFYDTLHIYYRFLGAQKLENRSELTIKNGLLPSLKNGLPANYRSPLLWAARDSANMERMRYFALKQAELEKLMRSTTLKDVVVESKIKRPVDVLDQKYTSGLFAGGDAYQFDITNDTRAQSSFSVFNYLQGYVPGLQISQGGGGISEWQLSWRGGSPSIFLDEMSTDINMAGSIPMSDIAYIKVFRPPFFGAFGGGSGGAISIYTKKGSDIKPTPGRGLNYKLLEGYSAFKQFYSPDYSSPAKNFTPDTRTTLFWQPYILTDAHNRKAKIEFYNNDISKKLRIIIEGFNANGQLTRTEKIIE